MKNVDRASRRIPPTISCTSILFHNLILFVFRMISCETWAVHLVEIDRASRRNRPFISCISIPLSEAAPCLFPSYPASNIAPPERGPGIPVSLGVDSAVVANLCKSDKYCPKLQNLQYRASESHLVLNSSVWLPQYAKPPKDGLQSAHKHEHNQPYAPTVPLFGVLKPGVIACVKDTLITLPTSGATL